MFALPISMPRFKVLFFYQNSSKIKLILQKNAKFLSAWGSAPVLTTAWGFTPRPPLVSVSWGFRPQNLQTAPSLQISGYAPDSSLLDTTIKPMA